VQPHATQLLANASKFLDGKSNKTLVASKLRTRTRL